MQENNPLKYLLIAGFVLAVVMATFVGLSMQMRKNMLTLTNRSLDPPISRNYTNLDSLMDGMYFVSDLPHVDRWEVETGLPSAADIEAGQDGSGFYVKDPYGAGARQSMANKAAIKAYIQQVIETGN